MSPSALRWSTYCWLTAVAAGVLEALVHAATGPVPAGALAVRFGIYLVLVVLIPQLPRRRPWVRPLLTVPLGGFGLVSLLIEPVRWLAGGGSALAYLAGEDAPALTAAVTRVAHVLLVLAALVLMYRPPASRFLRSPQSRPPHPRGSRIPSPQGGPSAG